MAQLVPWTSVAQAKHTLARRLRASKEHRRRLLEEQWRANERAIFRPADDMVDIRSALQQYATTGEDFDVGEFIEISYTFRALRFLHAQMSANPPVATPRPESPDPEDQRAARAADQVMKWALRHYEFQEKYDLVALDTLIYGSGFLYTGWNPHIGDILDFDAKTMEVVTEGDMEFRVVSPWDMFIDPTAKRVEDIRYMFEKIVITAEAAKSRFPNKWHLFRKRQRYTDRQSVVHSGSTVVIEPREQDEDRFEIFAYWENGLPENGFLGRHCLCFDDGQLLTAPQPSPFRFYVPRSDEERKASRTAGETESNSDRPAVARLPFHMLTDIDVPGSPWGKSFLEYAGPAQNVLRNLDSAMLDAAKAHGVARLILPAGADVEEDAISNSNVDLIKLTKEGAGEPHFISPPGLPAVMGELRANLRSGVDDLAGLNESMFGQQSREQSGFSMQYAVNQGSMIRRRVFNKSVRFVESWYNALIGMAVRYWDTPKALKVLGPEMAFDSVTLRGIDIDGGFEIDTEYGTSMPLDPTARRDLLLQYLPLLKEAGVDPRILLTHLRLGELESAQNEVELARDRTQEIIDTMVATGDYIPPRKFQDHVGMLAYLRKYMMTAPYFQLPEESKVLIEKHYSDRVALAAQEKQTGGVDMPGEGGGGAGMPPAPQAPASPGAPELSPGAPAVPPPVG